MKRILSTVVAGLAATTIVLSTPAPARAEIIVPLRDSEAVYKVIPLDHQVPGGRALDLPVLEAAHGEIVVPL